MPARFARNPEMVDRLAAGATNPLLQGGGVGRSNDGSGISVDVVELAEKAREIARREGRVATFLDGLRAAKELGYARNRP